MLVSSSLPARIVYVNLGSWKSIFFRLCRSFFRTGNFRSARSGPESFHCLSFAATSGNPASSSTTIPAILQADILSSVHHTHLIHSSIFHGPGYVRCILEIHYQDQHQNFRILAPRYARGTIIRRCLLKTNAIRAAKPGQPAFHGGTCPATLTRSSL